MSDDDLEEALDRLYGAPAAEFTAARDALARELRRAKRREDADRVKALRRPSAPAAAINRLARGEPERVQALVAAAEALGAAQEALLEGRADRDALRAAAEAERTAVGDLLGAARRLPDAPSATALEKLRTTLHAAATDPDVRAAIARGRLEHEAEAGGWGGLAGAPSAPPAPRRAPAKREGARRSAAPPRDERAERERREAVAAARAARQEAERGRKAAERDAKRAHDALESASQRAQRAREAVAQAEEAEQQAREEAQRTLRELKRAEALAAEAADELEALEGEARR